MTYEERCAMLGISRGKLEEGFPIEYSPVAQGKPPGMRGTVGPRIKPPPEDLSHLNSPDYEQRQERIRAFYRNKRQSFQV